jgi:hypothetical protein
MKERIAKQNRFAAFLQWLLFMRKVSPVILDYRNKVALDAIGSLLEKGNDKLFVHYGEAHMKGIVGGLRKKGWKIVGKKKHTVKSVRKIKTW